MSTTTFTSGAKTPKLTARRATIATIGVLCFGVLLVILHFLRPDLNPISEPTSAYAGGPFSFLMTTAFFCMSVASLTLVLALNRQVSPSRQSRIGRVLLGTWALGVLIAMIFPMDADGAPSTLSGTIHQTAGPLTFLALTTGMIFMSWAFQQDAEWRPFSGTSMTLSLLMLAAFVATFLSFAADLGTTGLAQRIALTTAVTWMLLVAGRLRSTPL